MAEPSVDFGLYSRDDLERTAIEACGPEQYYDLLDTIEEAADGELKQLIIEGAING